MGKRYYLLLSAYLTSSMGNWVYRVTLPLLVLHQTGSALSTSLVYVVEYLPFLLFSLPGGVWADRWNRRRILIGGDLGAGLIASVLAVLVLSDVRQLWPILLVALLLGCVEPVYHPAFQSFLPDITSKDNLGQANGWMQSGDNMMGMIGPVIAGVAISLFGYNATITFNALSYFVSAAAIALIGKVESPGGASLLFTGTNFATWIVQANFVYYLTSYRHLGPTALGLLLASQGAGAVIGAMLAGRLNKRYAAGRIIITTTAVAGCATLAMIPLRYPALIGIAWALLFGCASINMVSWFTLRHKIVPANLLGRVVATTRMLAFTSIPLAALIGGVMESNLHNVYLIFALSGVVRLLLAAAAWLTPLRADPFATPAAPETAGSAAEKLPAIEPTS
jgi:MFS family permease